MENKAARIVMVEDNPDDAEITDFFLNREGLQCKVERVDSRQSLELALSPNPPAAILCDLTLPLFSGLEAFDIAHRLAPKTPFLFFSGHTRGPAVDAARTRGVTHILSKENYLHVASSLKKALSSAQETMPTLKPSNLRPETSHG